MIKPLALPALALLFALPPFASAEIKVETVEYQAGVTTCEGAVAFDDANQTPRPGVLLAPDWMGVSDYAKTRAKQVAALGYVVFVADIYGKGARPATIILTHGHFDHVGALEQLAEHWNVPIYAHSLEAP